MFTACSDDDDEPCTNSQRPDFSVSFFEDGNNNPIKETKFFLPAYDDSISDLSNTTGIHYKIANCANGHDHTDIAFDYIYSGNLKIKIFPNPTDASCGKIIFWAPIGSECKRNEQIRLYVTDEKNNTSITSLPLIPQHYYKYNFLSTWATKSCPGFCHVEECTYLSVAKINKQNSDMTSQKYKLNLRNSLLLEEYFQ